MDVVFYKNKLNVLVETFVAFHAINFTQKYDSLQRPNLHLFRQNNQIFQLNLLLYSFLLSTNCHFSENLLILRVQWKNLVWAALTIVNVL